MRYIYLYWKYICFYFLCILFFYLKTLTKYDIKNKGYMHACKSDINNKKNKNKW
jgi:hypothetical protein